MNLFDWDKPQLKIEKPIRLIELFAGIGSQAKAIENLGATFEHYRICEFDKYAVAAYNAIHGTNFETSDITKITAADLGIVETDRFTYLLTYSFPCQDLSVAGKRNGMKKGDRTRSGLLWEVERILSECKELPQILLMENVPQVVSNKNIGDFATWCNFLETLGYTNKWEILNAKDFCVPQNRERCFMVSYLGDYSYEFPRKTVLKYRLRDILDETVDEKYYIKGEAAYKLCSQIAHPSRREISKTVRSGGRGSFDRHEWDIWIESCGEFKAGESDTRQSESVLHGRNRKNATGNGVQRPNENCLHGGGVSRSVRKPSTRGFAELIKDNKGDKP